MLLHRPVLTSAILLASTMGVLVSGGDAGRLWSYLLAAFSILAYVVVSSLWMHEFALQATRLLDRKKHIELRIFPVATGVLLAVVLIEPALTLNAFWQKFFDALSIGFLMVFYGMCLYCSGLAKDLATRRGQKIEQSGLTAYFVLLPLFTVRILTLSRRLGFPERKFPVVG